MMPAISRVPPREVTEKPHDRENISQTSNAVIGTDGWSRIGRYSRFISSECGMGRRTSCRILAEMIAARGMLTRARLVSIHAARQE